MFPSNPYEQPKDATLELLHDKMNVVAFAAIFAFASSSLNGGWPGHLATASFSLAYLVVDLGLAIFVPAMSLVATLVVADIVFQLAQAQL